MISLEQRRTLVAAAKTVMRGWCQHASVRNAQGDMLILGDLEATHFCASAAIQHCAPKLQWANYNRVNQVISDLSLGTYSCIIHFNDEVADCPEQVAQLLCEAAGP